LAVLTFLLTAKIASTWGSFQGVYEKSWFDSNTCTNKTLIGGEMSATLEAGFDETWIDNDDLRIKITPFISQRGQR